MLTSEVMRRAKEVLSEEGWQQGAYSADWHRGPFCVYGALIEACGAWQRQHVITVHTQVLTDVLYVNWGIGCIEGWNDVPGRTFDQVIDALDRAEKRALIAEEALG